MGATPLLKDLLRIELKPMKVHIKTFRFYDRSRFEMNFLCYEMYKTVNGQ